MRENFSTIAQNPFENLEPSKPETPGLKLVTEVKMHWLTDNRPENFANLDPETQDQTILEYKKNFNLLSSSERIEWFETFLAQEKLDPVDAVYIARSLRNQEEQTNIALFLGRILDSAKYAAVFQVCYFSLPFDEQVKRKDYFAKTSPYTNSDKRLKEKIKLIKPGTKDQLKEHIMQEDPDKAFMIAPFTDLTRYYNQYRLTGEGWKPKTNERKIPQYNRDRRYNFYYQSQEKEAYEKRREFEKSAGAYLTPVELRNRESKFKKAPETKVFFNANFNNAKQITQLVESWLDFLDPNGFPEEDFDQIYAYKNGIQKYVSILLTSYTEILLPYIPELIEHELITEDQVDQYLGNRELFFRFSLFKDEQDIAEEEKLIEILKQNNPNLISYDYTYKIRENPNLNRAYKKIQDRAKKRAANHYFQNFGPWRTLLSPEKQCEIIAKALESGIPVFNSLNPNVLNPEQLSKIFSLVQQNGDSPFVLEDWEDLKKLIEAGFENQVLASILSNIAHYGEESYMARSIVLDAGNVLSIFSEQARGKIQGAISANAKLLWSKNLDYAIDNNQATFESLMNQASNEPWLLVPTYNRIHAKWHKMKKNGQNQGLTLEDLRSKMRTALKNNFQLYTKFKSTFNEFFTKDEQLQYLQEFITSEQDHYYITEVIEEALKDPSLSSLIEVLKNTVRKNPDLLNHLIHKYNFELFKKLFSSSEITSLCLKNFAHLQFDDNDLSYDMFKFFAETDFRLASLEKASLSEPSDVKLLAELYSIKRILKQDMLAVAMPDSYREADKLKIGIKRRLQKLYDELLKEVMRRAEINPFILLEKDAIDNSDIPKSSITKEMINDRLRMDPGSGVILIHGLKGNWRYKNRSQKLTPAKDDQMDKSDEEFAKKLEAGFLKNIRGLAFYSSGNGNYQYSTQNPFPETVLKKVYEINPLSELLNKETIPEDFYKTVLAKIESNPFFPLVKAKLLKIASYELKRHGPRVDLKYYEPNSEFAALVKRIQLLSLTPIALNNVDSISKLSSEEQAEFLQLLEFMAEHNLDENLEIDLNTQTLEETKNILFTRIKTLLGQSFELEDLENINTLPDIQAINAMYVYFTKSCKKDTEMKNAAKEYTEHAFRGDLATWRAWGEGEPPADDEEANKKLKALKQNGLVPKNLNLGQYQLWLNETESGFNEVLEYDIGDIKLGINQLLKQAIADEHIKEDDIFRDFDTAKTLHDNLSAPMIAKNHELKAIAVKIQKQKKARKKGDQTRYVSPQELERYDELREELALYLEQNQDDLDKSKAAMYLHRIRNITVEELETRAIMLGKTKVPFDQVLKILNKVYADEHPDFVHDLQRLQDSLYDGFEKLFGKSKISKSKLTITDKFDLKTYIRIGSEPVPSCQNFDSDSNLNYGLLSYSMDPNVRFVQIYDENGQILTRAALRLLSDENDNPALFIERIYSTNSHAKINEAVINFAKQKAESMGIPFYTSSLEYIDASKKVQSGRLQSHGSRAPYVYTDAGNGRRKNGKYKITTAFQVN